MAYAVSIVVPVFNVEPYIARCARSLFEQTEEDLEFIFVDDCSKDRSIELLKRTIEDYPQRKSSIKVLHHEHNRGLSSTRNTGLAGASGKYIMFVDSDDWLERNAAEKVFNKAEQENADIVVFQFVIHTAGQTFVSRQMISTNREEYIRNILAKKTWGCLCGKLYQTEFFKKNNSRSVDGITYGEDYAVVPRILEAASRMTVVDEGLYHYDQSNPQSATFCPKPHMIDEFITVIRKLRNDFAAHGEKHMAAIQDGEINGLLTMLKQVCVNGKGNNEMSKRLLLLLADCCERPSAHLAFPDWIFYYLAKVHCFYLARLYVLGCRTAKYCFNSILNGVK